MALEQRGIVVARPEHVLAAEISTFIVIERESRVIACAQLKPLGASGDSASDKVRFLPCVRFRFLLHTGTGRMALLHESSAAGAPPPVDAAPHETGIGFGEAVATDLRSV